MKTFFIIAVTLVFALVSEAAPGSKSKKIRKRSTAADVIEVYCWQKTPATSHGYIIESATLTGGVKKPQITIASMGTGLLTQDGDGTAHDDIIETPTLSEDVKLKAKSKQWKNAASFSLPMGEGAEKVYTLYVDRDAFSGKSNFLARIRKAAGSKEANFILDCNQL